MLWACSMRLLPARRPLHGRTVSPLPNIPGPVVACAARPADSPGARPELAQRPLGRLSGLIAAGPAPVPWAAEEGGHAHAHASAPASEPGGASAAAGSTPAKQALERRRLSSQAPGWQAELQRLVELLPQALRAALLAREEFLEARRASDCVSERLPVLPSVCGEWACHKCQERRMAPLAACVGPRGIELPQRSRWPSAGRACLQVLEVVMDVGRPPLARFPAGDVRLSETLITYADLDEAIAKVPAGRACQAGVLAAHATLECWQRMQFWSAGCACNFGAPTFDVLSSDTQSFTISNTPMCVA